MPCDPGIPYCDRWPIPAWWGHAPVSSAAREGLQRGVTKKLVKLRPPAARASMLGVGISLPKQPQSEKPWSSARMTTILGLDLGVPCASAPMVDREAAAAAP